jgi:hypothetical protein
MKIIIARYNEDINWTRKFYETLGLSNVIIYNKGIILDISNEISMKNVGREGHTFFKYIYDNYDNLDNYTIFLQGNPYDHLPNLDNILLKYINDEKIGNLNINFEFLSNNILKCNLNGCRYHNNIPLRKVYNKLFKCRKEPNEIIFGAGGQFIISKEKILYNPKEFYLEIVKILEYNISPIEGYVIERFTKVIFDL